MDTNKNSYTFIFALVMVIIVAFTLSFAATSLKPLQDANLKQEKMQNILKTVGVNLSREEAQIQFTNYVKKGIVIDNKGNLVEEKQGNEIEKGIAFTLNMKSEWKRKPEIQKIPLFVAEVEGKTFYVIPLNGMGMWSDIWGNVALESDKNTIAGVNFDHASETSGLGAEITTDWFQKDWKGKKIMSESGEFASVVTVKGGAKDGDNHGVDAISGGTVTSTATSDMFSNRVKLYMPYFNKLK
ncbi:MAG: NADH:ubiquinone reductase (Na(+)-transporting) subunit C [Ichthyobacteriaceae bacterium]|nr:NADH:ubiquinone reductase (Na(+)-transporting) subunit C [Ichthyobacteriaceae bacterium]